MTIYSNFVRLLGHVQGLKQGLTRLQEQVDHSVLCRPLQSKSYPSAFNQKSIDSIEANLQPIKDEKNRPSLTSW